MSKQVSRRESSKTAAIVAQQTTRANNSNRRAQRERRNTAADRRGPNAIGGRRATDLHPSVEYIMSQVQQASASAAAEAGAAIANARSTAIAASWSNPEVRAARAQRHACVVGKVTYKSVPEAFRELGLPTSKMIRFRGELVANGKAVFEHEGVKHTFKLAPKAEAPAAQ
jgi:hypothetical protein